MARPKKPKYEYVEKLNLFRKRVKDISGKYVAVYGRTPDELTEKIMVFQEQQALGAENRDDPFFNDYAQRWMRAIEGVWTQREDGTWQHVSGGVKFDTPQGARHVRLMPFQVWFVVTTMLFQTEVDMEREYHDGDVLLPSEFVREVDDDPLPL